MLQLSLYGLDVRLGAHLKLDPVGQYRSITSFGLDFASIGPSAYILASRVTMHKSFACV
ncbi:hypothetical protein Hanom_Chr10g00893271 [Helianthus anomalus]